MPALRRAGAQTVFLADVDFRHEQIRHTIGRMGGKGKSVRPKPPAGLTCRMNINVSSLPRPSRQARGREYPQMAASDTVVPPHVAEAIRFHKLDREVDRVAK